MVIPIRQSVKVILINSNNEILLMCADDSSTTNTDGKYHGRFWFVIGGEINIDETIEQAAIREVFEETGITSDAMQLGPIVWFGEFDLILNGIKTHLKQTFIVATTEQNKVTVDNLTKEEKQIVKSVEWFSFDKILSTKEVIYPVVLKDYLPDILSGNYPEDPIEIDLAKQPS
jgi:8-oxo-dGTP pyrophosphatase MutT (NUDIX family)